MATLRYRTSDNWEKLHTEELPTRAQALIRAYNFTIGDFGISIGDLSIDGIATNASEIEKELRKGEN